MAYDPISAALDLGSRIIDRLWPNADEANKAKLELFKLQQAGELAEITAQLKVNEIEAANPSLFVSGWRPAVGWICASALAMQFVAAPIGTWVAALAGHPVVFPNLDMGTLLTLLGGMLGLGGLRTFEKVNGVARQ
jgi:hypothetical protein